MREWGGIVLILGMWVVEPAAVAAAERRVPSEYPTIQAAISAGGAGDVVVIAPGTYTGSGNRDISFLGKAITVRSIEPNDPNVVAATVVDCQGSPTDPHYGFRFTAGEGADSVLAGVTLANGQATFTGGGISCISSSPTITRCVVTRCSAANGGGIWIENAGPVIHSCTFTDNQALSGGAIWVNGGAPTIADCTFRGGTAVEGGGGAIVTFGGSTATIADCAFTGNIAVFGAAVFNYLSAPVLTGCTFTDNWGGHGGSVYNLRCNPTLTRCTFIGNRAYWGGGVDNYDGSRPTISYCIFEDNTATWGGAMVDFGGSSSTVSHCVFRSNSAVGAVGGGIACRGGGSTVIRDCEFIGNTTVGTSGGAVACTENSHTTIYRTRITGNRSDAAGGGLYVEQSDPTIANCTIAGNTAGSWGGGMICYTNSNATVSNCVISGNSAERGGGVACLSGSNPVIGNCTLAANTARVAGAGMVAYDHSAPTVRNSLLWGNSAPVGPQMSLIASATPSSLSVSYSDVSGGPDQVGVEPNCVLFWLEGNLDADPCFASPGGPDGDPNTWQDNDHHLLPGSPCINSGDPNGDYAAQTDIDGEPRVADGVADMGADEYWLRYSLSLTVVNSALGYVVVDPNLPTYPPASCVTLTAMPDVGKEFREWTIYDPNHPGDFNYAVSDANSTIVIEMNANREVTATFGCGSKADPLLPAMLGVMGVVLPVRRFLLGSRST